VAELIETTRDGEIVIVTLANAAKRNALSIPMRYELIAALGPCSWTRPAARSS
jgi:enoyl-CoA hydratase/carnithine racemase